jgi:hypothetical protein
VLMTIGILAAVKIERKRHRHCLQAHGLTRSLSGYHRPKLSANELNYSHITAPTTQLRRSMQLPFGIVSVGHNDTAGDDEERQSLAVRRADDYTEVLRPKRMKRPFGRSPIHIPSKSRHNSKMRKTTPVVNSPLSAITEFSDPPTSAELPEFPSHAITIPQVKPTTRGKYISTQWPLANTCSSAGNPTEITEIAARESVLIRKAGGNHPTDMATTPRSISVMPMASLAPEDPLPPLPVMTAQQRQKARALRTRGSNGSLDTIGSSLLLGHMSSPYDSRELMVARRTPTCDLSLKQEFATPNLQEPPYKKTFHGLVTGKSIRSLHPDMDVDDLTLIETQMAPPPVPSIFLRQESFQTIDASNWALPALKVNKRREPTSQQNRHFVIEPSKLSQWRAINDSVLAKDDVFAIGESLRRPASVAAGDPQQWGRQPGELHKCRSLTSLDGTRRGHKRQNCVRITNLPMLDLKASSFSKLPKLEEDQQSLGSPKNKITDTINAFEVKQPRPMSRGRTAMIDYETTPTPSPFKNAPILTSTARPARKQYFRSPTMTGASRTSDTPRPDSDVFGADEIKLAPPSRYSTSPRQWPLSPTVPVAMTKTSPSVAPSERSPSDSPMLPSPALHSSMLYPRTSLVKGPRSPRNSGPSRGSSMSPLQNKQSSVHRVTQDRDVGGPNAVRTSAMLLRSLNSDLTSLDQPEPQPQENEDISISPKLLAMPSPSIKKQILGLRASDTISAMSSATPSPTTEQEQGASRRPSPLGSLPSTQFSKPERHSSTRLSSVALNVPGSHISRSQSIMSTGGASIWEDASVRSESPEPDMQTQADPVALRPNTNGIRSRASSLRFRAVVYQDPKQYFNLSTVHDQYNDPSEDIENSNRLSSGNPSQIVQQLERVVSSPSWSSRSTTPITTTAIKPHRPTFATSKTESIRPLRPGEPLTPGTKREIDIFGRPNIISATKFGTIGRVEAGNMGQRNVSRSKLENGVGLGLKLDQLIIGQNYAGSPGNSVIQNHTGRAER